MHRSPVPYRPVLGWALFAACLAAAAFGCGDEANPPAGSGGAARASTSSAGGHGGSPGAGGGSFAWELPVGVPAPRVPAGNPMSAVKVELGRRLFYDKRLSGNQTYACASCHRQELAFTDGRAQALGSTGQVHPRSAMGLANVAYASVLTWANPLVESLEQQALLPMFGETPVELGLAGKEQELLARLRAEPLYVQLFPTAFPTEQDPISVATVTRALAAFERALVSFRSPYDRYAYGGDASGMSAAALRGRDRFISGDLGCTHCHLGFDFSDAVVHQGSTFVEVMFHNTGLYNIDGKGAYPPDNTGVFGISGIPTDMGRFRAPTLRNVAVTAPYMHDGSVATLADALDHYAAGGRTITSGPYTGVGSASPFKDQEVGGFTMTDQDRADVIEFLSTLTDDAFLHDPRFADPWLTGP